MNRVTTILIVDDNEPFRDLIKFVLTRSALHDFVECETYASAVMALQVENFDLIILEPRLTDTCQKPDVFDLIEFVSRKTPIIAITQFQGKANLHHMVRAGVFCLLLKSSLSPYELTHAVEKAMIRKAFFPLSVQRIIDQPYLNRRLPSLCFSEKEVLLLEELQNGSTAKQISHKYHMALGTIESMRKRMQVKTQTRNAPELVRFAIENGLIGRHQAPNIRFPV